MSVSALLSAYRDSAEKADVALRGKRLRVWGKATAVTRDAAGSLSVNLGSGDKTAGPGVLCLFAPGHASEEPGLTVGADVTLDGTASSLGERVTLNDSAVPHCAMAVCETLRAGDLAVDCLATPKDWSDSARFRVPSIITPSGAGGGSVECEPNDKVFYLMVNDLRTRAGANQVVLASPKARVVVSLASDESIPAAVETKARALVDGL